MNQIENEGELKECFKCDNKHFERREDAFLGDGERVEYLTCKKCETTYSEYWKCINWKLEFEK